MPSPTPSAPASPAFSPAWAAAVRLLIRWLDRAERADALLESLPRTLSPAERARVQHLFLGVLRHLSRLEREINRRIPRPPRVRVKALLLTAGFELIEGGEEGHVARVVHHAVDQAKRLASASEARLVNAVVRRMAEGLAEPLPTDAAVGSLAQRFSHPEWLVARWLRAFGPEATQRLLELHQTPARIHVRWRGEGPVPEWLRPAPAPTFYEVPAGRWTEVLALLQAGQLYIQDPATRHAVDLLQPESGETLLDACAAPGGKSVWIADRLRGAGRLVALDLPGPRLDRLRENLLRVRGVTVEVAGIDLATARAETFRQQGLPERFAGVLLDVPCSNTGVMRHRVDVRWRLQAGDIARHADHQGALLRAAADRVAPGGRLVYSTCSLEPEENEGVVAAFLQSPTGRGWTLEAQVLARPFESGEDGAGAFRLRAPTAPLG
ncbi:MAG: RNA methyltransferase [Verrucomicrobia bacterium]|nr:RNA methyltransferase [Verrucomicrobiota bacterium]